MLKADEKLSLKRVLSGYVCGSSFQEFVTDAKNKDGKIFEKVFVKENLSCISPVEKPYFSCKFLKPVCIHCGATNVTVSNADEFYPKCNRVKCRNETSITRTKRKIVIASDLASKNKKKKDNKK